VEFTIRSLLQRRATVDPDCAHSAVVQRLTLLSEWGVDVACQEKRDSANVNGLRVDLWRVAVGFELGQSTSAHNPLEYEGRGPGDGPRVTLGTLVSAVDFAPNPWLEVGAGAAHGSASGPHELEPWSSCLTR
jgi:hypothetical protein